METLKGPNLEVNLTLIEGYDFGFIGTEFYVVATMDNTSLKSNTFPSSTQVKLESEFIWSSNKDNIRKMRNYKVPVRLDFYATVTNKSFGYIILSLKGAQFLPDGEPTCSIKNETHKVCGTGRQAIGCHPIVVLFLRIQDVPTKLSSRTIGSKSSRAPDKVKDHRAFSNSTSSLPIIVSNPPAPSASLIPEKTERKLDDVSRLEAMGPVIVQTQTVQLVGSTEDKSQQTAEDLMEWKEREREKLQTQFDEKLKAELVRLEELWSTKEEDLEQKANSHVEICRALADQLEELTKGVKKKERSYEKAKVQLQKDYNTFIEETRQQTIALHSELLLQLDEKDRAIRDLEKRLNFLLSESKSTCHCDAEMKQNFEVKALREKLASETASKRFFKEQWARVVQELYRLKSDGHPDLLLHQLNVRKEHLEQLGLELSPAQTSVEHSSPSVR